MTHVAVDDGWIQSLSYERRTGCLEIHFTWNDVRQFWPIPLGLFRELWRGRPMYIVLHQKILPDRRIRWAFVRTEGKLVVSMLKGLAIVLTTLRKRTFSSGEVIEPSPGASRRP